MDTVFASLPRTEGDWKVLDPAILFGEDNGDQYVGKVVAVWHQADVLTKCSGPHKPERRIGIKDRYVKAETDTQAQDLGYEDPG